MIILDNEKRAQMKSLTNVPDGAFFIAYIYRTNHAAV